MSRTYRKIYAGHSGNALKWYDYHFPHWMTELSRDQIREHYARLPRRLWGTKIRYQSQDDIDFPEFHDWEHVHHWVFRNGSCRRQRVHGVHLTKRLENRSQRAVLRHELQRMMVYDYDDIPLYGTGSRHVRLGRVKKTC